MSKSRGPWARTELDLSDYRPGSAIAGSCGAPEWVAAIGGTRVISVPICLLVVAVAYGAIAQGAFYAGQIVLMVSVVVIAALYLVVRRPEARTDVINPLNLTLLGVAASASLSGWLAGYPAGANGVMLVMFGLLCASMVGRSASPEQQEFFVTGIVLVAVLISSVGVAAALLHRPQLAELNAPDPGGLGIWRAASTFTYTSSAAGFLLVPTLLVAARVARPGAGRLWRVVAWLLLVGLGATLSRGGLLGLTVGFAALLVLGDWRKVATANWSIIVGGALTLACLAPSLVEGANFHLLLAVVGVVAGFAVSQIRSWRTAQVALPALVLCGLLGATVAAPSLLHDFARVQAVRLNTHSLMERESEWAATLQLIRFSPVLGVGPGHLLLRLNAYGVNGFAVFTHNEYLELSAEQGVLGLAIVLLGLAAVLARAFRHTQRRDWLWSGGLAGLAGLGVHSGFDFLWHVAVISLVAITVLSMLTSPARDRQTNLYPSVAPTGPFDEEG